jgi:hypothetical protein
MPNEQLRAWAIHTLMSLAVALKVPADELKSVAFEQIAALHTGNPADYRRVAVPRCKSVEYGFTATAPNITRPQADFRANNSGSNSRRGF